MNPRANVIAFYVAQCAVLAVVATVLAIVFHVTDLDVRLERVWYDPAQHAFPWRYAWITKYGVHRYLKYLQLGLGVGAWIVALLASRAHDGFLASHRRRLWCVAASFVAVPIVIAVLHRASAMHCPWDVVDYGGTAPYFDLFSPTPAGIASGRCFPAAFVASGSWMLSLAWLWFPERTWRSVFIGLATLAWAFGLGFVQQMRGAHFLSHTLWSLWTSGCVVLVVHALCGAWREGRGALDVRTHVASMNRLLPD